jgi:hypothetical protein
VTIRIAMWSGPRNLSTAFMRSFGNRADTAVSDEPFYGAYLKASSADAPMREAVIASMDYDWANIARTLCGATPGDAPIWYQKHMAHHMMGPVTPAQMPDFVHAFLIRDPARVIASYVQRRETVCAADLGYARQRAFFDREADRLGHAPPVVDAAQVLARPAATLVRLCRALGIAWDPAMLHWEPGLRPTDGVWASHWYHTVLTSTGFAAAPEREVVLPGECASAVDECLPDYRYLSGFIITA